MSDVFILGAGFSKSINHSMPVMGELRDYVLSRLTGTPPNLGPFEHDLEQWMSYLATDQPWHSDQKNLENRALFLQVAEHIHDVVSEQERLARLGCGEVPPTWLIDLVTKWADDSVAVVTFNYDLLVERAIRELRRVQTLADLYSIPLSTRMAAGTTSMISAGSPSGPVPRIMKLHGSLNWRFGGITAPVTEELYLAEGNEFWDANATYVGFNAPRERVRFDHKIPLIVPPTGAKGGWYSNLALRAQWRRSAEELEKCTRLVVMGYSLPQTDLLVRHLVAKHLPNTCAVEVVNLTDDPARALERLLGRSVEYRYGGASAVENFTSDYVA